MKRTLSLLALLLFGGAWLGEAMTQDSGYVLIAYKTTSIEMSLWVMTAITLISFALLHWIINLVTHFRSPAQRLREWRHARSELQSGSKAIQGLNAGAQGDWWKSRRLLTQAGKLSSAPTLYYLEAARMAAKDGDEKEVQRLLALIKNTDSSVDLLVKQTAASLDLELGHVERARASLEQLSKQMPNNSQIKLLLLNALEKLQDWDGVKVLIPDLRKSNMLSETRARDLRRKYATTALNTAATEVEPLNQAWENLSFDAQQDISVKRIYIEHLISLSAVNRAETLLTDWIAKQGDDKLILLFSELVSDDAHAQLQAAKRWAKSHPDNAAMELCLARLSRRAGLWGASIQHYRKSLELDPNQNTEMELAQLLLEFGESDEATRLLENSKQHLKLPAPSEQDRKSRHELLSQKSTA